jgi:hypothetical protein
MPLTALSTQLSMEKSLNINSEPSACKMHWSNSRHLPPLPSLPRLGPLAESGCHPRACLVGGAVRDALLGRRAEYLDLDFVLPALRLYRQRESLLNHYKAGFVVLDAQTADC